MVVEEVVRLVIFRPNSRCRRFGRLRHFVTRACLIVASFVVELPVLFLDYLILLFDNLLCFFKPFSIHDPAIMMLYPWPPEPALANGALQRHLGTIIQQMQPQLIDGHLLLLFTLSQWAAVLHGFADDAFGDDVIEILQVLVL